MRLKGCSAAVLVLDTPIRGRFSPERLFEMHDSLDYILFRKVLMTSYLFFSIIRVLSIIFWTILVRLMERYVILYGYHEKWAMSNRVVDFCRFSVGADGNEFLPPQRMLWKNNPNSHSSALCHNAPSNSVKNGAQNFLPCTLTQHVPYIHPTSRLIFLNWKCLCFECSFPV